MRPCVTPSHRGGGNQRNRTWLYTLRMESGLKLKQWRVAPKLLPWQQVQNCIPCVTVDSPIACLVNKQLSFETLEGIAYNTDFRTAITICILLLSRIIIKNNCVWIYVCECICVWEREREKERGWADIYPVQFVCWNSNPKHCRMWLRLETPSLKRWV